MKNKLITIYHAALDFLPWPQSLFLLFVRLVWGLGFCQTGWGKLSHFERTVGFFTDLGLPFPALNAGMAACTEMVGGFLLALGICSRLVSLPLIFTMIIAYLTAERDSLVALFSSDYDKFFEAAPWPFLFACLIVLLFGPGRFSLDALVVRFIAASDRHAMA